MGVTSAARKAVALALIIFSVIAVVAKLLPVPFGVFVVPTRSMVPVIKPGDLVIVAGKHAKVGDIVVWCTGPLYCVVHRLIAVRDGLIVTKGDANPLPDNPVPASRLKGRVVAVIPRYVWIPLLLAALLFVLAPGIAAALREPEEMASPLAVAMVVFGVYLAAAVTLPLLYTSMSIAMLGYVKQPVMYLARASFIASNCTVVIHYVGEYGLHLVSVDQVLVGDKPLHSYRVGNDTVYIRIPESLLERHVEESRSPRLRIIISAVLTRMGHLTGAYSVYVPFKSLEIRVRNGVVLVKNPNCYPVVLRLVFLYADRPGEAWKKTSETIIVPKGSAAIEPPVRAKYIYVDVVYKAYGHVYRVRLRVR